MHIFSLYQKKSITMLCIVAIKLYKQMIKQNDMIILTVHSCLVVHVQVSLSKCSYTALFIINTDSNNTFWLSAA